MKHILKFCKNSYWRFIKNEDLLHANCIDNLVECYPDILYMHAPNEGKRTPFEQFKAKVLGVTPGIPDILIFRSAGKYKGLAVELKHGKNTTTPAQKEMLDKLSREGWACFVVRSESDFKHIMFYYTNNEHDNLAKFLIKS